MNVTYQPGTPQAEQHDRDLEMAGAKFIVVENTFTAEVYLSLMDKLPLPQIKKLLAIAYRNAYVVENAKSIELLDHWLVWRYEWLTGNVDRAQRARDVGYTPIPAGQLHTREEIHARAVAKGNNHALDMELKRAENARSWFSKFCDWYYATFKEANRAGNMDNP